MAVALFAPFGSVRLASVWHAGGAVRSTCSARCGDLRCVAESQSEPVGVPALALRALAVLLLAMNADCYDLSVSFYYCVSTRNVGGAGAAGIPMGRVGLSAAAGSHCDFMLLAT